MRQDTDMHRKTLRTRLMALLMVALGAHPATAAAQSDALQDTLNELGRPLVEAIRLIGTPYRMGGRSPDTGLDCSGLVRHVYKQTHGIDLPHNARAMSQVGEPVGLHELRPGDLVLFNTLGRPYSHVGIYKGDGQFVHASSRADRRVTVSSLSNGYWARRFDGARRITTR
ncbi:MAG: C40 family peptidase [Thiobacillaceae bacterium]|nr:C40 family peptidase [Thiobacillaceae bacterium]